MAEFDQHKVACKIRYYRHLKGISQGDFANDIGLTPQHFSKIECCKVMPSVPLLLKIAEKLGVDIVDLLY